MILCQSLNNVSVFPIATKGDITQFGTHRLGEKNKKNNNTTTNIIKSLPPPPDLDPKDDTSTQGSRSLIRGAPAHWQPERL